MIGYRAPQATSSVYVCNLPPGTDEALLAQHFGQIGVIKKDKRTGRLKIWIYRDKVTNEPKGDATVTYEDPHAASAAVEWFDNKDFHGSLIQVSIAESKMKDAPEQQQQQQPQAAAAAMFEPATGGSPLVGGEALAPVDEFVPEFGSLRAGDGAGVDAGGVGAAGGAGRGRGRGEIGGKVWQQEGDWPCPNPSCGNINFAFRGSCNRCNTSRPSSGSGVGGAGRGRGRGGDSGGRGGGGGAGGGAGGGGRGGGLFGPNDWNCPMCGNTNWAKRTKCNICNTTKPGHNEGGVREGRAGGYKELDEAELEETKRRRKELEEDDGEMYDEFGNLKKKFRMKAKHGENPGGGHQVSGSMGWDKEELGFVENEKKKSRSRDSRENSSKEDHNGYRRSDERSRDRSRERSRERARGDERDSDRDRAREKDRDREKDRARSKDRDRERDRERDRDRESYRERDRGERRGR